MRVTYRFANGEISIVEVEGEVAEFIQLSNKAIHAGNEKQRSHTISLDARTYEGDDYTDDVTPYTDYVERCRRETLEEALSLLSSVQRRRFELFTDGMSFRDIAKLEGVSHTMIRKSIQQSRDKMQKFLKNKKLF